MTNVEHNLTSHLKQFATNEYSDTSTPGKASLATFLQMILGFSADIARQYQEEAFNIGLLNTTSAPIKSLEIVANQRNIPLLAGLTHDQNVDNVLDAWNVWARAGIPAGIEQQVSLMGLSGRVSEDNIDTSKFPTNTVFPTQTNLEILVTGSASLWGSMTWGSFTWGEYIVENFPTDAQLQSCKDIIKTFKFYNWVFREIVIILNGSVLERYSATS